MDSINTTYQQLSAQSKEEVLFQWYNNTIPSELFIPTEISRVRELLKVNWSKHPKEINSQDQEYLNHYIQGIVCMATYLVTNNQTMYQTITPTVIKKVQDIVWKQFNQNHKFAIQQNEILITAQIEWGFALLQTLKAANTWLPINKTNERTAIKYYLESFVLQKIEGHPHAEFLKTHAHLLAADLFNQIESRYS